MLLLPGTTVRMTFSELTKRQQSMTTATINSSLITSTSMSTRSHSQGLRRTTPTSITTLPTPPSASTGSMPGHTTGRASLRMVVVTALVTPCHPALHLVPQLLPPPRPPQRQQLPLPQGPRLLPEDLLLPPLLRPADRCPHTST